MKDRRVIKKGRYVAGVLTQFKVDEVALERGVCKETVDRRFCLQEGACWWLTKGKSGSSKQQTRA